jgi:hypothetical protein
MKFKFILFPIIASLILVGSLSAQPGCNTKTFNPFDNYFYGDADFVTMARLLKRKI